MKNIKGWIFILCTQIDIYEIWSSLDFQHSNVPYIHYWQSNLHQMKWKSDHRSRLLLCCHLRCGCGFRLFFTTLGVQTLTVELRPGRLALDHSYPADICWCVAEQQLSPVEWCHIFSDIIRLQMTPPAVLFFYSGTSEDVGLLIHANYSFTDS